MMSDGGSIALVVALGVGVLLGYLCALFATLAKCRARNRRRRPRARGRTSRDLRRSPASNPTATVGPNATAPGTSGTVARCKVSGQVELTLASYGPAQVSIDLARALAGIDVPATKSEAGRKR